MFAVATELSVATFFEMRLYDEKERKRNCL